MFGIDVSSDPTKFQGDWPSGSRLIGVVLSFCVQCIRVSGGTTCQMGFFSRTLILLISDVLNRFDMSISRSPAIFKKIGEGQIFPISRDLGNEAKNSYFQNMLGIT